MVGAELAVGYLFAWAVRKARRVAVRADAEADNALDAGMDRLHEVVVARLGQDPALERAAEEATSGLDEPTERTRRRLTDALEDAAERDALFAEALEQAVATVRAAARAAGDPNAARTAAGNVFHGPAALQIGDHNRQDNHFGA